MVDPSGSERSSLAALTAALGARLSGAAEMASGDNRATWRIQTTAGTFVVRSDLGERAARQWIAVAAALGDAEVPAPRARLVTADAASWLVMDEIHGTPGNDWLDTPARSRTLARSMGAIWRRLQVVDPRAIRLQSSTATSASPGFVHGDFAPINVLVDDRGEVVGLLDFEHAHEGDPLEDIAWWGWVVRHHHPAAWEDAWPTFCSAAGVDATAHAPTLRSLMLGRLRERAEAASTSQDRERWHARLDEAATW